MKGKLFGLFAAVLVLAGVFVAGSPAPTNAGADDPLLPIIFVHGGAGSAAQYESNAQRFASNGYPNVVTGLDRFSSLIQPVNEQMDDFFDAVMAETGASQIYVVAHSAGTSYMVGYLNDSPARSARVAKYINIDGAKGPNCPGNPAPVNCMNISQSGSLGPINVNFPQFQHTQCVTAPESFAVQYKFFTGKEPKTTLVLPEPPSEVEISGRAIYFPANIGVDGATLQIWEVHDNSGARKYDSPMAVINLGPTGEFGPVAVNGMKYYEFAMSRPEVDFETHYYFQPFIRDNHLIRLLATPADSDILKHTPQGPDHTAVVILRYFDYLTNGVTGNDTLWVTTKSPAWDNDPVNPTPPTLNILSNPAIAPRTYKLGIHAHDANADKVSTLALVPWFATQAFQTGVDIWMPATEPPDGTITFMNEPAGNTARPQTINIPNWASEGHRVLVMFNNYFQDINSWPECKQAKPSPCK